MPKVGSEFDLADGLRWPPLHVEQRPHMWVTASPMEG